jgi:hypothetical protein
MRTGRAAPAPQSLVERCGALATRRVAAWRDTSTDRGGGFRATASAAVLAPVAGLGSRDCIAAELACAAQSTVVVVVVLLLQSIGAEALPSSCELALLGRMAALCRLMIAARLVAAEQLGDMAADLGRECSGRGGGAGSLSGRQLVAATICNRFRPQSCRQDGARNCARMGDSCERRHRVDIQ